MSDKVRVLLPILGTTIFAIMTLAMLIVALVTDYGVGAFLLALLFGGAMLFSAVTAFRHFRQRQDEVMISGLGQQKSRLIKIAAEENGRLTPEEAAMKSKISVQQAEALLDNLVDEGRAETWVTDGGSMVYVFRNLLEDDKSTAEDPLKQLEA